LVDTFAGLIEKIMGDFISVESCYVKFVY